jgi:hypothetical protein
MIYVSMIHGMCAIVTSCSPQPVHPNVTSAPVCVAVAERQFLRCRLSRQHGLVQEVLQWIACHVCRDRLFQRHARQQASGAQWKAQLLCDSDCTFEVSAMYALQRQCEAPLATAATNIERFVLFVQVYTALLSSDRPAGQTPTDSQHHCLVAGLI